MYVEGQRVLQMKSEDGHSLSCRFNVGNVKSMLLAMSEMEDDDWEITISRHYGRYAVHHWSGQRVELWRTGGT